MKDRFFDKLDWAAFWTATLATAAVYFYTLGPSVGLEDSGELATAAANLGVPHPPGYPFWTFCSWLFCKAFCWVTYMGHPTPAWCVSLCSAVFGAFAAGCTAMLICRSAHDFISGDDSTSANCQLPTTNSLLCFGGAVGGALTFAFSPVEWSQSTIVEIYSLNALFLMWVFLLSYRWMRKPSDKILWFTAFVFGLGLTNYQVLLFAIVPLALIIALKNIGMFRDVFIYLAPVALTYQILQIGSLQQANQFMSRDVINKHDAVLATASAPATWAVALGLVILVGAVVAAAVLMKRGADGRRRARETVLYGGAAGAFVLLLSATLFTRANAWSGVTAPVAPLIEPWRYAFIGALIAGSVVAAVLAALQPEDEKLSSPGCVRYLAIATLCAVVAIIMAAAVPEAGANGYQGPAYPWTKSTLMFLVVLGALFAMCAFTPRGLCFAIPVAGLHIAAFILLRHGAMNGLTHPCSWWFCWPIAWNFVLLALAWVTLPNGRSVAGAAFFAQLGVSFYIYMPIVSDLRNPPMNWGYPRTWEGFKHAIQRGQYEAITFNKPTWGGIMNYFGDVLVQFTDVLALLALVPFAVGHWIVEKSKRRAFWQWMVPAVVCFLLMSVLLIGLANVKGDVQDGFIQKVKFISSHAMIALWIGYGLVLSVIASLKLSADEATGRRRFWTRYAQTAGIALVAMLAFWAIDCLAACLRSKFLDNWGSNAATLVSVVGKCLCLITLLILMLTAVASLFRRFRQGERAFAIVMMILAILVAGVTPIWQNYHDDRLVFELGGAEQNGHTFGWQFGAYQLDGAKAIREQLTADEEPLPDPDWPEAMEPFSIFFGGTDPGRFVPTYMIYSADFRPDVYLITQNALADDTYMSVERDLYGDEIWIPSKDDSAEAFNIYVDEVKRGVRQANGDLKIENGRVQVTGALGVMEINGILTKMMFDHDRLRHSFYLEESYVIPWMYPYLSPHGLIMKINKDRTPYDAKTAAKDRDFWDWYVRRLLNDPMYRRDFAGQKSFSKLRAALAGLYAKQGRRAEAAQAYREACLLYPASPEATFRYAQEILLPYRRWTQLLELMDYTDFMDPNNRRTQGLREYVRKLSTLTAEIERLETKRRSSPLDKAETYRLAQAYFGLNRTQEAAQLLRGFVDTAEEVGELAVLSQIFDEAGFAAEAEKSLTKYLKLAPKSDPTAWIRLAKLQYRSGRKNASAVSFHQALVAGADREALNAQLAHDEELVAIYKVWVKATQAQQQIQNKQQRSW